VADPYRLERFVVAQDRGGVYQRAAAELRAGTKQSHWMWFVFPQIEGLGSSAMAREFAISSLAEARAYLDHPVLGPRLAECARILAATDDRSATQILGDIDAAKLRSSMTLFMAAAPDEPVFGEVLAKYFDGEPDKATLARLMCLCLVRRPVTQGLAVASTAMAVSGSNLTLLDERAWIWYVAGAAIARPAGHTSHFRRLCMSTDG